MKKYLIGLVLLMATAIANAQTGVILINRTLGGTDIQSRSNLATHTFAAFVQNGTVLRVASWGTSSSPTGWSSSETPGIAQDAFNRGLYTMIVSGGDVSSFDIAYSYMDGQPLHLNLFILGNCKFAAHALADVYQRLNSGQNIDQIAFDDIMSSLQFNSLSIWGMEMSNDAIFMEIYMHMHGLNLMSEDALRAYFQWQAWRQIYGQDAI